MSIEHKKRPFSMLQSQRGQRIVGMVVFALFVAGSMAVNQSVQALNQSAGSYGYYGGTYGYNALVASSDFLPNAPSGFSPGARSANQVDFSWTAPTLTTGSTSLDNLDNYTVAYATTSLSDCTSGTTTTTSSTNATLTSLSSGTTYYIAVCTNDTNGNQSTGLTSSMTTTSGGGGGGGGGGSSSSTSSDSTADTTADTSSEASESTSTALSIGVATSVSVGASTHTVNVSAATDAQATLTISSDPVTLTINKGETQDLDTDSDGIKDLRLTYNGLVNGSPSFTFVALASSVAYTAPSGQGLSPVTGKLENITAVVAGDYIKSPSFSTVYYVTGKFTRRPFIDGQTYFTWQDSFSGLKTVSDATLSALPLEGSMLPKPGVVLVKIQSDPKTYAVTSNPDDAFKPILRWVASEAVAKELYGAAWASYVIDVPPTLFPRFSFGASIEKASDLVLPPVTMKMRTKLN